MMLASLFMPTPGGSGGLEGLFVIFQGPLFENKGFIGIAVFMWRVISFYITIGLGMWVLSWYLKNQVAEKLPNNEEKQESEADQY